MKILRAHIVLPLSSPPIEDGVVRIVDGRIVQVGRWQDLRGEEAEDLGQVILMPGLINAHCHLDYTAMRDAIPPQRNFPEWIARINELKGKCSDEDYLASIRQGFDELRQWGTTGVFNLESFPRLMERMPLPPIRTWWFYELLDVRNSVNVEETLASARAFFARHPDWKGGFGLSPHAPYSASSQLYQQTKRFAENQGIPWTTHLAETGEEFEMFRNATGPLHDFLRKMGRPMNDVGTLTPLARLLESGSIPQNGILAHMNCLEESDYELLADKTRRLTVVHCPKCHEYFDRPPFDVERFRALAIPVCLGTDSLASNTTLNLFEEMRSFQDSHPRIPLAEILDMVTRRPAAAIGLRGELGEITAGAHADLIAIPYRGGSDRAIEGVLSNHSPVEWMCVAGKKVPLSAVPRL